MIYALNVYDIIPGREDQYAAYVQQISPLFEHFDMAIVAAGDKPIRTLMGQSRNHFALVRFADIDQFDGFMAAMTEHDCHKLREGSTENYIWTLYEPWGFNQ